MSGINVKRWILGGIAAGISMWVIEGIASAFYADEMQSIMASHNLSMDVHVGVFVISILVSLICGLTMIFIYTVARSRFGHGPKTAVLAAIVLWFGGYLPSLVGYYLIGLFPVHLLVLWGIIGLTEMSIASLLGGWIYRE